MKISLFQTEWGSTFLYSSCSAASNSLVKAQELEVLAWAAQGKPIPVPALSHLHHPLSYTCFIYIHVSHIHFLTHTRLSLTHTHIYVSFTRSHTHTNPLTTYTFLPPSLSYSHMQWRKISSLISVFTADLLIASFCTGSSYESHTALCCCGFLLIKVKITP